MFEKFINEMFEENPKAKFLISVFHDLNSVMETYYPEAVSNRVTYELKDIRTLKNKITDSTIDCIDDIIDKCVPSYIAFVCDMYYYDYVELYKYIVCRLGDDKFSECIEESIDIISGENNKKESKDIREEKDINLFDQDDSDESEEMSDSEYIESIRIQYNRLKDIVYNIYNIDIKIESISLYEMNLIKSVLTTSKELTERFGDNNYSKEYSDNIQVVQYCIDNYRMYHHFLELDKYNTTEWYVYLNKEIPLAFPMFKSRDASFTIDDFNNLFSIANQMAQMAEFKEYHSKYGDIYYKKLERMIIEAINHMKKYNLESIKFEF